MDSLALCEQVGVLPSCCLSRLQKLQRCGAWPGAELDQNIYSLPF